MKKINLLLKRILPCLLIIVTVFALASCKGCKKGSTNTYPSVTPNINDPKGTYLSIGDYKVTNETVYTRLLLTYGLETLQDMIAKDYLAGESYDPYYSDEDFNEKYEEIIYGDLTDEAERAEALEAFNKDMRAIGLFTEAERKAYYKLTYDKMNYVVKVFKDYVEEYNNDEANEEDYFTEEQFKEYHETNNLPKVSAIVVTFDSQYQALQIMEKCGVNINKLTGNWEINGAEATAETLKEAFINIYNEVNESKEAVKEYEAKDLNKISATIKNKVYGLEVLDAENISKSYTHAPNVYGNRYFLVLKTAENKEGIKEYDELTDKEKEDIFHALVENSISDHNITKILGETFTDLKIYDEGLETRYIESLTTAYEGLGSKDEICYKATTDEDAKVIARYNVNGTEKTITAQALFDEMLKQYGAALTFSLLQQYSVLSNSKYNSVYNILNGQILDQEKYDKYYKTDVRQYKTSFEAGNYASSGFPASYGWENFLRDYLGVNKEEDLMISLDSSLFKAAQDVIAETVWLKVTEGTNEDGTATSIYDDSLVQTEMENIYNKFYNAAVIGLYAFYDKDNDNIGDIYDTDRDSDAVSEALLELAYNKAEEIVKRDAYLNKTLETALTEVVNQYNLSSTTNKDSIWYSYKRAGLRLFVISTVTYTSSSAINDKLSSEIKILWDAAVNFKDEENGTDITGKSLDPSYRYTITDEDKVLHAHSVSASDFTSHVFFTNNANENEDEFNIAYKVSLTKATNASYIGTATSGVYKPTYKDYQNYLKDSTSVTTSMKTAITTYYIPAINNILKIDGVSNAKTLNIILDMVKDLVDDTTVSVNNAEVKIRVEQLIKDTYTETPEVTE